MPLNMCRRQHTVDEWINHHNGANNGSFAISVDNFECIHRTQVQPATNWAKSAFQKAPATVEDFEPALHHYPPYTNIHAKRHTHLHIKWNQIRKSLSLSLSVKLHASNSVLIKKFLPLILYAFIILLNTDDSLEVGRRTRAGSDSAACCRWRSRRFCNRLSVEVFHNIYGHSHSNVFFMTWCRHSALCGRAIHTEIE